MLPAEPSAALVGIPSNPVPEGAISGVLRAADGVRFRYARWNPPGPKRRGTVCILQGRTEFIEKYFEVVAELRGRGFAVAALDWRGQGGSDRLLAGSGRPQHVEHFDDYLLELDAFMRQVVLPDCPPPYYGLAHSMGGLICLRALRTRRVPFARAVLSAPMVELARPSPRLILAASWLGMFLGLHERPLRGLERHSQDVREFPGNALTGDPRRYARTAEVLRAAPRLAVGAPTVGWLYAAQRAMREAAGPDFGHGVATPVLLIAAGNDRVVSLEAVDRMAHALKAGAQVVIPGARHEPMMEQDPLRQLFWAAFDAFIPGAAAEAAPSFGQQFEHLLV